MDFTANDVTELQDAIRLAVQTPENDTITLTSPLTISTALDLIGGDSSSIALIGNIGGSGLVKVTNFTRGSLSFSGALTQTGFNVTDASQVAIAAGGSYVSTSGIVLEGVGNFTNLGVIDTSGGNAGINVGQGGTVTNGSATATAATIRGGTYGIVANFNTSTTVENYGFVTGSAAGGIAQIQAAGALTVNNRNGAAPGTGGVIFGEGQVSDALGVSNSLGDLTVTNESAAKIVGRGHGISGTTTQTVVTNAGTIAGGLYDSASGTITLGGTTGVRLGGGSVTNLAGGRIESGAIGIQSFSTLKVDNAGTIAGGASGGIRMQNLGDLTVVNRTGGAITGGAAGIELQPASALELVNLGSIKGAAGVMVNFGTLGQFNITNASGATIEGTSGVAVQLTANRQSRIDNYGTIDGTAGAIASGNNPHEIALHAGSTTGAIALGSGDDEVALYTGVVGAAAVTVTDPLLGGDIVIRAAGDYAAAGFGSIAFGGGAFNGLVLRGTGTFVAGSSTGTNTTGAAGSLDQGSITGATSYDKQESGTWTLTGTNPSNVGWLISGGALNVAGTLQLVGIPAMRMVDASAVLRVANGGTVSATGIAGNNVVAARFDAGSIVNAGTISTTDGQSAIFFGDGALQLLNTGMISNALQWSVIATGAGSGITNAAGGTLAGGTDTTRGIGLQTGDTATIDNYGTISGSAVPANSTAVLIVGGDSDVNLHAGSTTGTVKVGANTRLSLHTGTGTGHLAVTTTDRVTGQSVTLQNAGTNAAAVVGDIALGLNGAIALKGGGDGTAANGAAGTLDVSAITGLATLVKEGSGTWTLAGANTYAGGTTLKGGTLKLADAAAAGTGRITFDTGAQTLGIGAFDLLQANEIVQFQADDTLVLAGATVTATALGAGNVLTVTLQGGATQIIDFADADSFAGKIFAFANAGGDSTLTLAVAPSGGGGSGPAGSVTADQIKSATLGAFTTALSDAEAAAIAADIKEGKYSFETYVETLIKQAATTVLPAVIFSGLMTGTAPSEGHLRDLVAFGQAQFASYKAMGSSNPALGVYEALGLGFAETIAFSAGLGAAPDATFSGLAYAKIFGRTATAEQIAHFDAQLAYFESLYKGAGQSEAQADLHAKGAVFGQMVGHAVIDEAPLHGYDDTGNAFLKQAVMGQANYGGPLGMM